MFLLNKHAAVCVIKARFRAQKHRPQNWSHGAFCEVGRWLKSDFSCWIGEEKGELTAECLVKLQVTYIPLSGLVQLRCEADGHENIFSRRSSPVLQLLQLGEGRSDCRCVLINSEYYYCLSLFVETSGPDPAKMSGSDAPTF